MSTTASPLAGTFNADPVHSSFGFAVRYQGVSLFKGTLDGANATLTDGKLEGTAQVESISIRTPEQFRAHVLSDDFFAADKHPEVAFRSSAVRVTGEDVEVEGELTIKGITNHVVAKGTLTGPVVGLAGTPVLGLALETVVDRTQYGLTWNADLPSGGKALANDVKIVVEAELVKTEA